MRTSTRHSTFIAWIACLAILFNAFVPMVSYAMAAQEPRAAAAVQVEVCTAFGMEVLPLAMVASGPERPDTGHLHKSLAHCGFCAAHAATYGLPPPMTALFAPIAGRDVYPPLYYHSPRPLFPWSLAQPRAPPPLS
jgi:hypothetical protein